MKTPFLRTPYNYDTNAASDETGINCQVDLATGEETPSLTKQSFRDECDINTIVQRFGLTGELPTGVRMPTYGDFEDLPDYHQAMNAIRAADEAFYAMPADVRARFNNSPGAFVDFCSKQENHAEAVKLGLALPQAAALARAPVPADTTVEAPAPAVAPKAP